MPEDLRPNPNHQELLNLIPGELHPVLIPILKKWDQGVNDQFAKIRGEYAEYAPFKALIDANIDPTFAQQAVALVNKLQNEPEVVLKEINQNWGLGYVSKDEVSSSVNNDEDPFNMDDDLFKDPRFKAMADGLNAVQEQLKKQQEEAQNQSALEEFEEMLDSLEEKAKEDKLPFDRTFVTAFISQGYSGEDAVSEFHKLLAAQGVNAQQQETTDNTNNNTPPAVLGGSPSGSGIADGSVAFGKLTKNDLNGTIEQMLAAAQQSGQG